MCGIAGIMSINGAEQIDRDLLIDMISILRHRGPDESGIYIDPHVGLGHVRLSVIGIGGGGQPICNEDGTLWIVYNGEAFNYIELKEELLTKGHCFTTQTDTEVLLHLYEELGPAFLSKVNGQFALAIWDSRRSSLFLASDRVGIRPLYYCNTGNSFIFASEIKSILLSPQVPREFDAKGIAQVFTFWSTLASTTAFRDIHRLPPGHYLTVTGNEIALHQYWQLPYYPLEDRWTGPLEEAVEELRTLIKNAVQIRLRADVPVGAYLSGGLDSSIITTLIANYFNNSLRTFSINFQESSYDETESQRELIGKLNTSHSQIIVSNAMIRENFPQVVWHSEVPLLRTGPVPMFLLSRLVRSSNFKVVLSGEGADEIFGGYNIFKEAKIRSFWGRNPSSTWRPLLVERLYHYIFNNPARGRAFLQQFFAVREEDIDDPLFSHAIRWEHSWKNSTFFSSDLLASLGGHLPVEDVSQFIPAGFAGWDVLAKAQYWESFIFLPNYLLTSQGDRVGMANSIEMRHPFLDFRVIDFAARLPAKWKIRGLTEKFILKKAFGSDLPASITNRPKQPYRAPISQVFFTGGSSNDYVDELLSERCLKETGYFDPAKVSNLVRRFRTGGQPVTNEFQNMALAGILSTQLLHHQFISGTRSMISTRLVPDKQIIKS